METIGRIRRAHFLKGKTIKKIARDLKVSRNTVRRVLHPLERVRQFPPGVAYIPKPWQPLNVLVAAEEALASAH